MKRLFLATVLVATALLIGACASYRYDDPTQRAMEEPWMPPKALAAFKAGEAHYEAGNMKKAIAKFEQAVDIYPDFGDAYARLEMIYRVLDRYQDLIRVLEEQKRLYPERADTIQWSIDRYRLLEEPPRAAIKALHRCRGHKSSGSKDAIAYCKKAIRIHPPYTDAHYLLGVLFIWADDEKSAKEVVATLIPLDPFGASPMLIYVMTESKPQWLSDSYSKELERLFAETEGGAKQPTKSPRTRLSSDARESDLGKCSDASAPDTYSAILPEMVRVGSLFSIGKYEVTQGQWRAIMGKNPSNSFGLGDDYPVANVSLNDVQEYIRRLNAKTCKRYRLPTEAEWEIACHGGKVPQKTYCGGEGIELRGWYKGNSGWSKHPVGRKWPNRLGIYDMTGNVSEWTSGLAPSSVFVRRVVRGGAFSDKLYEMRSARRFEYYPDARYFYLGFRLAQDL